MNTPQMIWAVLPWLALAASAGACPIDPRFDQSGGQFAGVQCDGADLRGARLAGARFDNAVLTGARFDGADLSDAVFISSGATSGATHLAGASFANAVLDGSGFYAALAFETDFSSASLIGADLASFMPSSDFSDADLSGASLSFGTFYDSSFVSALFDGALFADAMIANADFSAADLRGALDLELGTFQFLDTPIPYFEPPLYNADTRFPTGFDPAGAGWRSLPEPSSLLLIPLGWLLCRSGRQVRDRAVELYGSDPAPRAG